MRVAMVVRSYEYHQTAEDLLNNDFTTTEWVEALSNYGIEIYILYRFYKDGILVRNGITYHFFGDNLPAIINSFYPLYRFHKRVDQFIKEHQVDLVHAHHPALIMANLTLRHIVTCPILLQIHSTPKKISLPYLRYLALRNMEKIMFSSKGTEQLWINKKILKPEQCCFVMEYASSFKYQERHEARTMTEMNGEPVFIHVGNLNENKDPLTVLKAFYQFLNRYSSATLYMIFRENELVNTISNFIKERPILAKQVYLLGKKDRKELEVYYNSADYIISASHREGSGYSVLEAISCGVVPILSKIPTFEDMTLNGKIGALFQVGNDQLLYKTMIEIVDHSLDEEREKTLQHHKTYLSFDGLVHKTKAIYQKLLNIN